MITEFGLGSGVRSQIAVARHSDFLCRVDQFRTSSKRRPWCSARRYVRVARLRRSTPFLRSQSRILRSLTRQQPRTKDR